MSVWGFDQPRALKLKAIADNKGAASVGGARDPAALQARWESWIFMTPADGIPAASGSTPGVATCAAFYINRNKDTEPLRADPTSALVSVEREVYNIAPTAIPGDTMVLAVDVSGDPVAIGPGSAFDCNQLCDCDLFADSESCVNCCGRCEFEATAITNFSATVNGVDWSQDGDASFSGADKCNFTIPMRSTADDTANAYASLSGEAVTWTVDLNELGALIPTSTDGVADPCNATHTFNNLVDAQGQFDSVGTIIPACSCCGITFAQENQIGCKFGPDPISNFSGTSFASGQPVTQVGPSVQINPCAWDVTDNESTIWNIQMDADGYFRASETNGLVYGGEKLRVDQQACNGTVILRDQAGSQTVQFTSTAVEEGCNPFTPAALSVALRRTAPELFPPGGCSGCNDAANLLDAYGVDVSPDHLDRIAGEFERVSKQPKAKVIEKLQAVITRAREAIP